VKRILLIVAAAFVAPLVVAPAVWAFGTKDVVQMHRDGVPDSLILQKIEYSGTVFHLDARDMRDLRQAGVPDEIVSAMLATEDQPDRYEPYYRPYYHSYVPYYRPFYYPYYPRVVVGFSFYGHHGPYPHRFYGRGHTRYR
jgi:hypothetical protein